MATEAQTIYIVGAGLAGSECALQLADMGYRVVLFEMRQGVMTPAHKTDQFAELVCSNSFGSFTDYSAPGQLKWEAEQLGSFILKAAKEHIVPAGMALAVDRERFSALITEAILKHPRIEVRRELVQSLDQLPRPLVVATGPLTHDSLAESLRSHLDEEFLYFFDAIAPIVDADSIDTSIAWKANRYNKAHSLAEPAEPTEAAVAAPAEDTAPPGGDYFNCPLDKEQYYHLIEEIKSARKIEPKEFETTPYFQGCMPIEAIVDRGDETLRFGPLSPKGLFNPHAQRNPYATRKPYAVVQLRQDNKEGTAYNMVGFQTRMAYGEQIRVLRMIPGLEQAEFLKLGSIHRNLYIHSPKKLTDTLSSRKDEWLFFAGQITGVEGYFESTCTGLLVAHFLHQKLSGQKPLKPPRASALGSLLNAITEEKELFQPTNINFGLFPKPPGFEQISNRKQKEQKKALQLEIAKTSLLDYLKCL